MKNAVIVLMVFILGLAVGNFVSVESKLEGIEFQLATIELQTNDVRSALIYEYVTVISEKYVTNYYTEEWPFAHGFGLACLQIKHMLDDETPLQEIEATIERIRQAPDLEKFMEEHNGEAH